MGAADAWASQVAEAVTVDPDVRTFPRPRGPVQLDAGVFLARTAAEQLVERAQCSAELSRLRTPSMDGFFGGLGEATSGVQAAAEWSLGESDTAPVSFRTADLTGRTILFEMTYAVEVVRRQVREDWPTAVGAYVWLRWLTGEEDSITYPLW